MGLGGLGGLGDLRGLGEGHLESRVKAMAPCPVVLFRTAVF